MHSFENTIQKLRSRGYKLTPQRLAVIKYMLGNTSHPSATMVYKELKRRYPTISFSTVYNTLNTLEKVEEIRSIHVFDEHLNFDPETKPHIHFHCKECNSIKDVFLFEGQSIHIPEDEIDGHKVDSYEIVFTGTCKDCR